MPPKAMALRYLHSTASSGVERRWFATETLLVSPISKIKSGVKTKKIVNFPTKKSDDISKKEKKAPYRKKKKKKSKVTSIELLQLQDLHSREVVEERYERIAQKTEFNQLKWIGDLKKKLESPGKNDLWKRTHFFLQSRKIIPQHVKDGFWDLIVAETAKKSDTKKVKNRDPLRFEKKAKKKDQDVRLFQRARDLSVEFPLFWSMTRKRKVQKHLRLKNETNTFNQYLKKRSELLGNIHQSKTSEEQELECIHLVETLKKRLPATYYEKIIALFQGYIEACEREKNGSRKSSKERIKMLFSNIQPQANTHAHLVAPALIEFFYINIPDAGESTAASVDGIISSDHRVLRRQKAWDELKDEFVSSFQAIHSILLEERAKKIENDNTKDDGGNHREDDSSEESVLSTFDDAAKTAEIKEKTNSASHQSNRPRFYNVFEALSIGDWAEKDGRKSKPFEASVVGTPLEFASFPSDPPLDRLVFIDNLPIDITESRLKDAYSRCGDIETMLVFHRRPDLDPGRKADDSKKKIRNPSSSRGRWERPRTPLYAIFLYKDVAGATKAVSDPLRIFGMVLDKHLIRSHRALDMTKLYLEDIGSTHNVTSIEYELSQILHPELYVCLDIGSRQYKIRGSSNCVIKFPTFEAAYWSYLRLSNELKLLEDENCALHWMETPRDAMKYWTRELNF